MRLDSGVVHLWQVPLEQSRMQLCYLSQILASDEHTYSMKVLNGRAQQQFVAARGILRIILSRYIGVRPQALHFTYNYYGKPALEMGLSGQGLHFNVSHSYGLAVYAITRDQQIGIDVEYIRPLIAMHEVARHYFSSYERSVLRSLPSSEQQHAFFRCWTRKEAFIKAMGGGLSFGLDQFDVSLAPGEPAQLRRVIGHREQVGRWYIQDVTVVPHYAAALAGAGESPYIEYFDYNCEDTPLADKGICEM